MKSSATGVPSQRPPENDIEPPGPVSQSRTQRPNFPTTSGFTFNLEGALPLLLIGSALLCYAAVLANQELGSTSTHLPLWGLFGAVGAIIAGAGIYSTFFVPAEAVELSKDWVTVPKAEWDDLRAKRPTTVPPPARTSAPAAVADLIRLRSAASRPIWEEDWDVDSEGFRAAAAPPAPADFVLRQIDEIEASIRKKRTRPPPD